MAILSFVLGFFPSIAGRGEVCARASSVTRSRPRCSSYLSLYFVSHFVEVEAFSPNQGRADDTGYTKRGAAADVTKGRERHSNTSPARAHFVREGGREGGRKADGRVTPRHLRLSPPPPASELSSEETEKISLP